MKIKVQDSVVVITGASSGIGRAAALEFARRGAASLVLAARRKRPLQELAKECEELGATAIAVSTDMSNAAAVKELATRALSRFGRIDVWVNDAGVGSYGRFDEVPLEEHEKVIETNLLGTIYGARAALRQFRLQNAGVLINISSMLGKTSVPFVSSYVASKHAVRGLGISLRQELWLYGEKDIHVCTVMPACIDTPFFAHAGNHTGRAIKAMSPVYPAKKVAKAIVNLVEKPQREVFVGAPGLIMSIQHAIAPGITEKQEALMTDRLHFYSHKSAPKTSGSILAPRSEGAEISGGWRSSKTATIAGTALIGAAALGMGIFLAKRHGMQRNEGFSYDSAPLEETA